MIKVSKEYDYISGTTNYYDYFADFMNTVVLPSAGMSGSFGYFDGIYAQAGQSGSMGKLFVTKGGTDFNILGTNGVAYSYFVNLDGDLNVNHSHFLIGYKIQGSKILYTTNIYAVDKGSRCVVIRCDLGSLEISYNSSFNYLPFIFLHCDEYSYCGLPGSSSTTYVEGNTVIVNKDGSVKGSVNANNVYSAIPLVYVNSGTYSPLTNNSLVVLPAMFSVNDIPNDDILSFASTGLAINYIRNSISVLGKKYILASTTTGKGNILIKE